MKALVCACALLAACQDATQDRAALVAAAPLVNVVSAYEEAGRHTLDKATAQEYEGLHNVFQLSANVISGSEPHGEDALERIAQMGVKTILSTDGKVPDAKTAARHGMRYVHVPIKYSGISKDELLRIAKTFRELEPPFFVHCFHGKHRGPAGAAVGRLVLDGASRARVLAEMRQWCGTAKKYEGLFQTIASAGMPSASETGDYEWDFPAAHPLGGFRNVMVAVTRHSDNLKLLAKRAWRADPEHPDLDAQNEADKLAGLFSRGAKLDSMAGRPRDFRDWMDLSAKQGAKLVSLLKQANAGEESARAEASKAWRVIRKTCGACHADYRNDEN